MKKAILHRTLLILLGSSLFWQPVQAQDTPDWSGVWGMQGGTIFDQATKTGEGGSTTPGVREHPPYNGEYEAIYLANLALRDAGVFPDPNSYCGIPTDKQVWIISENGANIMRIYTDGRGQPPAEDLWPTHSGNSVGHWEGDTLVFETLSLHSSESGITIIDRTGLELSDAARIVTRMGINADGQMQALMTIEDAKALTAPWVVTKQYRKLPEGTRVFDYACNENNRNPIDPDTGWTYTIGTDGQIIDINPGL